MTVTLSKGGGKLSKRQGDVAVEDFRAKGHLPEALINFNALLGWHPKDDNELFTLVDLEKVFNFHDMGTSSPVFDLEKLDYMNGYYIRKKTVSELAELCLPFLQTNLALTRNVRKREKPLIEKVVAAEQERLKRLSEIAELTEFFFVDGLKYDKNLLAWKKMTLADAKKNLGEIANILAKITEENWKKEYLESTIVDYLKNNNLNSGEYRDWETDRKSVV